MDGLEPQVFFDFFKKISAIPRCSGNEKALSDYIFAYAKAKGFSAEQDDAYNVIVKKPGTKGYENSPSIILQGHLDMVCEKEKDILHDFLSDGIKLIVEGEFIRAKGTTLGADDGVAVAYTLALLESENIAHPPLVVILTVGEEIGMTGAAALSPEYISAERLINLDSSREGTFTVSCAGGMLVNISLPINKKPLPAGYISFMLSIEGLKGGHSGGGIVKERGNAIRLLGRIISAISDNYDIYMDFIDGGSKENAIPREAEAKLFIPEEEAKDIHEFILKLSSDLSREYRINEPLISIKFYPLDNGEMEKEENPFVLDRESLRKTVVVLNLLPQGVLNMDESLGGSGVETSSSLGKIRTEENRILFAPLVRSSSVSRKYYVLDQIRLLAELTNSHIEIFGDRAPWEFRPVSPLRAICVEVYREMFGREPILAAVHGGLECGYLSRKRADLDAISIGPDVFDEHTPNERMSIPSVKRTWDFLVRVLEKLGQA